MRNVDLFPPAVPMLVHELHDANVNVEIAPPPRQAPAPHHSRTSGILDCHLRLGIGDDGNAAVGGSRRTHDVDLRHSTWCGQGVERTTRTK